MIKVILVAVIAALIGIPGILDIIGNLIGKDVAITPASYSRLALFLMCAMYIAASIKNRKKKKESVE